MKLGRDLGKGYTLISSLAHLLREEYIQSLRIDEVVSLLGSLEELITDRDLMNLKEPPLSDLMVSFIELLHTSGIKKHFMNYDSVISRYNWLLARCTFLLEKSQESPSWDAISEAIKNERMIETLNGYHFIGDFLRGVTDVEQLAEKINQPLLQNLFHAIVAEAGHPNASHYAMLLGKMHQMNSTLNLGSLGKKGVEYLKDALFSNLSDQQRIAAAFFTGYSEVGITDTVEMIERLKAIVANRDDQFDAQTRRFALTALQRNAGKVEPAFFESYFGTKERQRFDINNTPLNVHNKWVFSPARQALLEVLDMSSDNEVRWNFYFYDLVEKLRMPFFGHIDEVSKVPLRDAVHLMLLMAQVSGTRLTMGEARALVVQMVESVHPSHQLLGEVIGKLRERKEGDKKSPEGYIRRDSIVESNL